MEKALLVASVMGPIYVLVGLSVLLYAGQWQKVIESWKKDHLQMMTLKLLMGILGLIIIQMYNVWEWNVWVLVTLTGWCMLAKSVLYFLLPGWFITGALDLAKNPTLIYAGGLVSTVACAVLSYYVYFL